MGRSPPLYFGRAENSKASPEPCWEYHIVWGTPLEKRVMVCSLYVVRMRFRDMKRMMDLPVSDMIVKVKTEDFAAPVVSVLRVSC